MKFNQAYNREGFLGFLENFLPADFNEKEEDIVINEKRSKEIKKAQILGVCESLNLHVLELEHDNENDPRIAIASDAFKILADHWIHQALVIFRSKNSENYRLSLLTITLDVNEKSKVLKKYSNARRYSFYLGKNAKIRTPEQQLIKKGAVKDASDLFNRFSVEVVNNQFYLEVAKHFDELVSTTGQNLVIPGNAQDDSNIRKSFAVRLIGRIMFCWFLKQKKSADGQLIPEALLSSKAVTDNYYHSTLEPLFFGVLNTSVDSRDIRSDTFDKVPYLNGGLFNPHAEDFYELDKGTFTSKHIDSLNITDDWFKDFFELLETYNFTIDENTIFDQELSVDPEMLGRIFENLLAEINPETGNSERKRTGSFYTPRQIVEYMVDQSLVEYFKTKTDIEEKKLAALVSYDLSDDADFPLELEEKHQIIDAIESLRILDPACGSGAYPIGALQKIVYILQRIDLDCTLWLGNKLKGIPELYRQKIVNEVQSNPFDYTRKLDVIKNSIFGVDIQPIAVDVSRLRCFLTLVVESEVNDAKPNRGIEPLPNLDFKFVCANSLIGLPKKESAGLFEDHSGITELAKIMSEYFTCNSQRKNEIKIKFTNIQKEILNKTVVAYGKNTGELTLRLTSWNPFSESTNAWFDPEWMFGLNEKFDIVIANPPYVDSETMTKSDAESRKVYKDLFATAKGNWDLFVIFIEKGFNLLKGGGVITYIVPNKLIGASYTKELKSYLLSKNVKVLRDYSRVRVFKEASVYPIVFVAINNDDHGNVSMVTMESETEIKYRQDIKPEIFYKDIYWDKFFLAPKKLNIILKLNGSPQLSTLVNSINDAATVSEAYKIADFIQEEGPDKGHKHVKFINTGTIDPYVGLWGHKKTKYIKKSYERPVISDSDLKLLSANRFKQAHSSKIIVAGMSSRLECFYDDGEYLAGKSTTVILENQSNSISLKYLLGIMNSKLMSFWFTNYFNSLKMAGGFLNVGTRELGLLPIVIHNKSKESLIEEYVEKINSIKKQNAGAEISKLEAQIDQVIYKLYELTPEEVKIVEGS